MLRNTFRPLLTLIFLPILLLVWLSASRFDGHMLQMLKKLHVTGKREQRQEKEASYNKNICVIVIRLHLLMCATPDKLWKMSWKFNFIQHKGFWSFHSSYIIGGDDPEDWCRSTLCLLKPVYVFIRSLIFCYKTFVTLKFGTLDYLPQIINSRYCPQFEKAHA